jgi:hypothetical protein
MMGNLYLTNSALHFLDSELYISHINILVYARDS